MRFIGNDMDVITNSELNSFSMLNDNTSFRASSNGRNSIITRSAALASVNEETVSSAHNRSIDGVQIERAGSGDISMHKVLAVSEVVDINRERSDALDAGIIRVKISITISTVAISINSPFSRSTDKMTGIDVESVVHAGSFRKSLAANRAGFGISDVRQKVELSRGKSQEGEEEDEGFHGNGDFLLIYYI